MLILGQNRDIFGLFVVTSTHCVPALVIIHLNYLNFSKRNPLLMDQINLYLNAYQKTKNT